MDTRAASRFCGSALKGSFSIIQLVQPQIPSLTMVLQGDFLPELLPTIITPKLLRVLVNFQVQRVNAFDGLPADVADRAGLVEAHLVTLQVLDQVVAAGKCFLAALKWTVDLHLVLELLQVAVFGFKVPNDFVILLIVDFELKFIFLE